VCTHPIPTAIVVTRAGIVVAFAVVALAGLPGIAAAAAPVRETAVFSTAVAMQSECDGTLCTDTSVFVSDSSAFPAQACVNIHRYEMPVPGMFTSLGFENGCAGIAAGTLSLDAKTLSGASLPSTSVTLEVFACDQNGCQPTGASRNVTVSATYSGIGSLNTFRGNSKATFGDCTMFFGGKGSSRQATASLTIDGSALDANGFLSTSTQKSKVVCH
jgi:hypothetical protein